jgi:hypothetical protein
MMGIPPPPRLPRDCWAGWYWSEVCDAVADHEKFTEEGIEEGPLTECPAVQDLITGAVEAGVVGHRIPVAGFSEPVQLSTLLAPYRTHEGGAAEREHTERRRVLDRPVPRRYR